MDSEEHMEHGGGTGSYADAESQRMVYERFFGTSGTSQPAPVFLPSNQRNQGLSRLAHTAAAQVMLQEFLAESPFELLAMMGISGARRNMGTGTDADAHAGNMFARPDLQVGLGLSQTSHTGLQPAPAQAGGTQRRAQAVRGAAAGDGAVGVGGGHDEDGEDMPGLDYSSDSDGDSELSEGWPRVGRVRGTRRQRHGASSQAGATGDGRGHAVAVIEDAHSGLMGGELGELEPLLGGGTGAISHSSHSRVPTGSRNPSQRPAGAADRTVTGLVLHGSSSGHNATASRAPRQLGSSSFQLYSLSPTAGTAQGGAAASSANVPTIPQPPHAADAAQVSTSIASSAGAWALSGSAAVQMDVETAEGDEDVPQLASGRSSSYGSEAESDTDAEGDIGGRETVRVRQEAADDEAWGWARSAGPQVPQQAVRNSASQAGTPAAAAPLPPRVGMRRRLSSSSDGSWQRGPQLLPAQQVLALLHLRSADLPAGSPAAVAAAAAGVDALQGAGSSAASPRAARSPTAAAAATATSTGVATEPTPMLLHVPHDEAASAPVVSGTATPGTLNQSFAPGPSQPPHAAHHHHHHHHHRQHASVIRPPGTFGMFQLLGARPAADVAVRPPAIAAQDVGETSDKESGQGADGYEDEEEGDSEDGWETASDAAASSHHRSMPSLTASQPSETSSEGGGSDHDFMLWLNDDEPSAAAAIAADGGGPGGRDRGMQVSGRNAAAHPGAHATGRRHWHPEVAAPPRRQLTTESEGSRQGRPAREAHSDTDEERTQAARAVRQPGDELALPMFRIAPPRQPRTSPGLPPLQPATPLPTFDPPWPHWGTPSTSVTVTPAAGPAGDAGSSRTAGHHASGRGGASGTRARGATMPASGMQSGGPRLFDVPEFMLPSLHQPARTSSANPFFGLVPARTWMTADASTSPLEASLPEWAHRFGPRVRALTTPDEPQASQSASQSVTVDPAAAAATGGGSGEQPTTHASDFTASPHHHPTSGPSSQPQAQPQPPHQHHSEPAPASMNDVRISQCSEGDEGPGGSVSPETAAFAGQTLVHSPTSSTPAYARSAATSSTHTASVSHELSMLLPELPAAPAASHARSTTGSLAHLLPLVPAAMPVATPVDGSGRVAAAALTDGDGMASQQEPQQLLHIGAVEDDEEGCARGVTNLQEGGGAVVVGELALPGIPSAVSEREQEEVESYNADDGSLPPLVFEEESEMGSEQEELPDLTDASSVADSAEHTPATGSHTPHLHLDSGDGSARGGHDIPSLASASDSEDDESEGMPGLTSDESSGDEEVRLPRRAAATHAGPPHRPWWPEPSIALAAPVAALGSIELPGGMGQVPLPGMPPALQPASPRILERAGSGGVGPGGASLPPLPPGAPRGSVQQRRNAVFMRNGLPPAVLAAIMPQDAGAATSSPAARGLSLNSPLAGSGSWPPSQPSPRAPCPMTAPARSPCRLPPPPLNAGGDGIAQHGGTTKLHALRARLFHANGLSAVLQDGPRMKGMLGALPGVDAEAPVVQQTLAWLTSPNGWV